MHSSKWLFASLFTIALIGPWNTTECKSQPASPSTHHLVELTPLELIQKFNSPPDRHRWSLIDILRANPTLKSNQDFLRLAIDSPFLLEACLAQDVRDTAFNRKCLNGVIRNGNIAGLRIMLSFNVNIDSNKNVIRRPLSEACFYLEKDAMKLLLQAGADPNAGRDGYTALHFTAAGPESSSQRFMIEEGSFSEEEKLQRDSVGYLGELYDRECEIILILLKGGAIPSLRDNKDKAPIDLARKNGNVRAVEILREAALRAERNRETDPERNRENRPKTE